MRKSTSGIHLSRRDWLKALPAIGACLPTPPLLTLAGRVAPLYQEEGWMLDAARFEPFGLTLVQAYGYLTEFADTPIADEKLALLGELTAALADR